MSQRILKCTVCGGDHSIFHCKNKCGICHGDNWKCSCSEQPPAVKKKKTEKQKQSSSSKDDSNGKDLRKLYNNLHKEHERVGKAFQNLQEQNEQLAKDLAEWDANLEEMANLVNTKEEQIKNKDRQLLQAKKVISELKAEVESLRRRIEDPEPDHQQPMPQQQPHSLSSIHGRYERVLQVINDDCCSMANAFRLAGCPRSTVRDFMAIAELKIVDHQEHDRVIRDHAGSVKELEAICRTRLRRYLPVLANLRREGKLLPLKFDERFYDWCCFSLNKKTAPLGATTFAKVNDQQ